MPVPAYGHAEFTITTSASQAIPQIFIPTLASLGTPMPAHDRIIRVHCREVTPTAATIPAYVLGIVNNTNSGITFGSETALTPENQHTATALMSKYKLYSSGTTTITGGTTVRHIAVNPRLPSAVEWYELRGADTFTIWTPQTTAAVTLLISMYIGE